MSAQTQPPGESHGRADLAVPRWALVLCGQRWFGGRGLSRRDVLVIEAFCLLCAAIGFAATFVAAEHARLGIARVSTLPLLGAYLTALTVRIVDRYRLWPGAANALPERPRTWRTIVAEYAFLLGAGFVGIATVLWLAT